MSDMFEQDADALTIGDDKLAGIAQLAKRAKLLEKEILELETTLSERQSNYRKLTEEALPEAFAELGLKSFAMEDGSKIEVKQFYSATISKDRQAEAFAWLRERGYDDIIKNTVTVRFGRREDELCARLLDLLSTQGYMAEQSQKIESQTLKAWVKEMLVKGSEVPTELFGVYVGNKASIKST